MAILVRKRQTERSMEKDPFKDIELPANVYKYRDWNNDYHKKLLINKELFLSSPALFNDPFDCKIPIAYWKLSKDDQLAFKYFSQIVERRQPHLTPEDKTKEIVRLLEEGRFKDPLYLDLMEKDFFEKLNSKIGIVSLTAFPDNVVMWSHYSNSHKGFCIGFNSKTLFSNPEHFGTGGKVIYEREFPVILPTESLEQKIIKQTYIKSDVWAHEKEYRLTKFNGANETVQLPEECVTEIRLGCSMNASDKNSIINISRCNFPSARILQAKQIRNTFKIAFETII